MAFSSSSDRSKDFPSGSTQYDSSLSNIVASNVFFRSVTKSFIRPAPSQRAEIARGRITRAAEARRIAKAIARLPEFLMQRPGFYQRRSGSPMEAGPPYHVALEDSYIRAHRDEIAICLDYSDC
jgi:hypothetical protein